jgi:hypothetical protein
MVLPSTGSIQFATVCFVEIHSNSAFETRPEVQKIIKISKVRNHKYGIHVKKQHSTSEMTALPTTI